MNKELIEKIKSRGYWRITFQPLIYKEEKLKLGECLDIVQKNKVSLRGWDYPFVTERTGDDVGLTPCNNFYEGWVSWSSFNEYWRMYQSGQFLHYLGLNEDWKEEDSWGNEKEIKPGEIIGITGSITYHITEVFEFLSRLAINGIYDDGVLVSISLNNTKSRKLKVMDPMRMDFLSDYKAGDDIKYEKKYTKDELITKPKDLAFDVIIYICGRFGWHKPSVDVIKKDQEDLFLRRF
jgi:hypothetical protein